MLLFLCFSFWKFHVNFSILLRISALLLLSELLIKLTIASGLCAKYGLNLHEIVLQMSEGTRQG